VLGRLRLTLASLPAGRGGELEAARGVPGLIAPEGKVVTADALHCNCRAVAAINEGGGDWCLALRASQDPASVGCPVVLRQGRPRPSGSLPGGGGTSAQGDAYGRRGFRQGSGSAS